MRHIMWCVCLVVLFLFFFFVIGRRLAFQYSFALSLSLVCLFFIFFLLEWFFLFFCVLCFFILLNKKKKSVISPRVHNTIAGMGKPTSNPLNFLMKVPDMTILHAIRLLEAFPKFRFKKKKQLFFFFCSCFCFWQTLCFFVSSVRFPYARRCSQISSRFLCFYVFFNNLQFFVFFFFFQRYHKLHGGKFYRKDWTSYQNSTETT